MTTAASAADLQGLPLFDGLSEVQVAQLAAEGELVAVEPGVVLFGEGEPALAWWVLVDGTVDLVRRVGREDVVVARMDSPGRWAGGFRAWDEHGSYLATGRGARAGRIFRLPAEALRDRFADWFPFGAHLISGVYHTARSIESTARQRSSLITLGTLAAGLAHEINNPASAATRAAEALDDVMQGVLTSLGRLARQDIAAAQFAALDSLRQELAPRTTYVDPLVRADRQQVLESWLDQRGVASSWQLAASFSGVDVDTAWFDRVEDVLPVPDLEAGLHWVAGALEAHALLLEVRSSTRRITELVAAVRSYSQMDRASRQRVQVTSGLDNSLVMLGHKTGGITVVREYAPDLPEIDAFPGELNQLWTNLIDNAVDAMDGEGTLRLRTRAEGDGIVVEVADTGPGMPVDVQARAFEAFFTTKEVGSGTGLGLDIAQRIVQRHGGEIDIRSGPDGTVMQVRLPLDAAD